MAHHVINYKAKCKECDGSGVYVGMCERDGAGVVCRCCDGSGCYDGKIEYDDFEHKIRRDDIERVFQTTCGIVVGKKGKDRIFDLSEFGGMPYQEWYFGMPFPPKSEMRKYVCPAQWYQSVDYSKKPKWDWCIAWGMFSRCERHKILSVCWERFDREQAEVIE